MIYRAILLILVISIFSSCIVDSPGFRGLYSYYKVTKEEHPSFIQRPGSDLCNLTSSDPVVVYKINGLELKKCLQSESKTLVYFWDPNCSAAVCVPPNYAQDFCKNNNVELFIVAMYYEYTKMSVDHHLERPIFGVDTEYYRSNFTDRYMKKFREELLGRKLMKDEKPRFLLFQADSLIASSDNIDTIDQLKPLKPNHRVRFSL